MTPPTLRLREWTCRGPTDPDARILHGRQLTDADRRVLGDLKGTSLAVEELRAGLRVTTGAHVGTVTFTDFRIVVLPKIGLRNLMRMVGFAFELDDLRLSESSSRYALGADGLVDLLGLSLLHAVERLVRGGLLPRYETRLDDLPSPRGRIDILHAATHPRRGRLRCEFDELTDDHLLNQALAAGRRLAARVVDNRDLGMDLARAADRFFADHQRVRLDADVLARAHAQLSRRSSHYQTAMQLISLLFDGSRLEDHAAEGRTSLASFLLNMNDVFERFLERHLRRVAPPGLTVLGQDRRDDAFQYAANPSGWHRPTIRPDLVFRQRGSVLAIGDAKYKNRHDNPPSSAELYQLTTYGLAYPLPAPRTVLLFHPLAERETDRPASLTFAPGAVSEPVEIRLVGVPVDRILEGERWWPNHPALALPQPTGPKIEEHHAASCRHPPGGPLDLPFSPYHPEVRHERPRLVDAPG